MLCNTLNEKIKGIYIQPYATLQDHIFVFGPTSETINQEIVLLSYPQTLLQKRMTTF
jgi:hypothetical protein